MKELLGIILLTLLVVLGSCNSNTYVSLMKTSPQLFGVRQVSSGNPDYRNRELFIVTTQHPYRKLLVNKA